MIIINGIEYEQKRFSDGTPDMRRIPQPGFFTTHIDIDWCFDDIGELPVLSMLVAHYKECLGAHKINLFVPYLPGSRQERVEDAFEDCFALKYLARMLNALDVDVIRVYDAHSNVSTALLDRVVAIDGSSGIDHAIDDFDPDVIFYADARTMSKYGKHHAKGGDWFVATSYGSEIVDLERDETIGCEVVARDEKGAAIEGMAVLLITDDVSDDKKIAMAIKALEDAGAMSIAVYASHCEASALREDVFGRDAIEKVFTTDSLLDLEHMVVPKSVENKIVLVERFRKCKCKTVFDDEREVV